MILLIFNHIMMSNQTGMCWDKHQFWSENVQFLATISSAIQYVRNSSVTFNIVDKYSCNLYCNTCIQDDHHAGMATEIKMLQSTWLEIVVTLVLDVKVYTIQYTAYMIFQVIQPLVFIASFHWIWILHSNIKICLYSDRAVI